MKHRRILAALWLFLCLSVSAAPSQLKVAVVCAASADAQLVMLAELLGSILGQEAGVVVLDRACVSAALAEQNLTLSGMAGRGSLVGAGQLLGCDVFVVFDKLSVKAGQLARWRLNVFDARMGLRLGSATRPSQDDFDESLRRFGDITRIALRKAGSKFGGVPVSILSVRPEELAPDQQHIPELVAHLLELRLANDPGVKILDRRDLSLVSCRLV